MGSLAIGTHGFLERLTFRPKDESVTRQHVINGFTDRLGEGAILFAKVEQRYAHGAKSMAVPLRASRKIEFQSVSADKHLVRHRTDSLRRACPLYTGGQGCLAA